MNAPSPKKSARRRSREVALQGLYQWLVSPDDTGLILSHAHEFDEYPECDKRHFNLLLQGCIQDCAALNSLIAQHIDRQIQALSPIEHAVLMIGTWELVHSPEIPYRVVINEAVELAKLYGATDGHKFVNGVLDRIAAETRSTEIQDRTTSA